MSEQSPPPNPGVPVERPEVMEGNRDGQTAGRSSGPASENESVEPGKVMRIGSMIKQLLEEVRSAPVDEASRDRLREIYLTSIDELSTSLSPDLAEELGRLTPPFHDELPSEAELRVAKAQLVGWLEGLFHGIQATLVAQQMAARDQLQGMRRTLPPGQPPENPDRPGTYL